MRRKVGFATVFTEISRKGALPEEASIFIAEITAIKVALKKIHRREVKNKYVQTLRAPNTG